MKTQRTENAENTHEWLLEATGLQNMGVWVLWVTEHGVGELWVQDYGAIPGPGKESYVREFSIRGSTRDIMDIGQQTDLLIQYSQKKYNSKNGTAVMTKRRAARAAVEGPCRSCPKGDGNGRSLGFIEGRGEDS